MTNDYTHCVVKASQLTFKLGLVKRVETALVIVSS